MADFETQLRQEVADLATKHDVDVDKAFRLWYAIHAFRLELAEAFEAASYDGGNDRGIDLFYVDDEVERVVIVQTEYLKRSDRRPSPGKLALLLDTLDELAEPQELRNAGRTDLAEAAEALIDARSREYSVHLQLVYPGAQHPELDRVVRRFNRQHSESGEVATIVRLDDLQLVYEDYLGAAGRVASDTVELVPGSYFTQDAEYGRSLVATIPGRSLQVLWQRHKNRLFDQNIRLFLPARKGTVNAGIKDTLDNQIERQYFWAYNNGITIVASNFELNQSNNSVTIEDFSIVNGCQTTVSIAESASPRAEEVQVLGRIIAANPALVDNIIRFTNSQTPINVWDLSARDKIQKRLQRELQDMNKPWFYSLRRGEFESLPNKADFGPHGSRRLLPFPLAAQFLAAFRGLPVEAYKDKAKLFTTHRDKVFPSDIAAREILWAWILGEAVDQAVSEYLKALRALGEPDPIVLSILKRGQRFFVTAVAAQLLRLRNGPDFVSIIDTERLHDRAMKDRLHKYALMATAYYVSIMRTLLGSGGDLGILLRNADTWTAISHRVDERMIEEKLAPRALDERLPKLPDVAK